MKRRRVSDVDDGAVCAVRHAPCGVGRDFVRESRFCTARRHSGTVHKRHVEGVGQRAGRGTGSPVVEGPVTDSVGGLAQGCELLGDQHAVGDADLVDPAVEGAAARALADTQLARIVDNVAIGVAAGP
jgi:hypothetical protein